MSGLLKKTSTGGAPAGGGQQPGMPRDRITSVISCRSLQAMSWAGGGTGKEAGWSAAA